MKRHLTNKAIHETTRRMQAQGYSVRSWSEKHGFNQQTVRNLLNGQYRLRNSPICNQIRAALIAEGFVEVGI